MHIWNNQRQYQIEKRLGFKSADFLHIMRKEEVYVTFHNQLNRNNGKNLLIDQNLSDQK